ncbi:exported hypothetical protein [Desulfamplus magnetovallimortis]|uniref:PKD domain-containing protein n=1 Tax=Desulfamplus magnetovallimortis TaxID=1246637 RepID=A0A1W1HFZ9_9BACT|nr:S41 family peptidase [Desulfamplus magnetovallimortis]SLM31407.1 exported hypothetical protein [Desulfamplus magnetovallimortis]
MLPNYFEKNLFQHEKIQTMAKKLFLLFISTLVLLPGIYFFNSEAKAAATLDLFNKAWDDFDQNYSYFAYKNIDWDHVHDQYQQNFMVELSPDDFAYQLNEMLQTLHDWHVWVGRPDGEYLGYNATYKINYPDTLFMHYTRDGSYEKIGDNVIFHAIVDENIAHIFIDTLSSSRFSSVSDNEINSLFSTYADTDGMIIDIRSNNGGSEDNAAKFASHFTDTSRLYGHVKYRNPGSNHNDFGDIISKTLEPSQTNYYNKPVACLIGQRCMSSAEWFTLMMKACPNVTLIGDKTRGASGNPKEFSLSNGVSYSVSSWVAYSDKMVEIEDRGIEPEIYIPAQESVDNEHDYVLEKAIAFIKVEETLPPDTPDVDPPEQGISLVANRENGTAPFTVDFSCLSSLPDVSDYIWTFGDDSPEITTTKSNISHTYDNPGFYIAFVTALDEEGFIIDMASLEINVTQKSEQNCIILSGDFSLYFPHLRYGNMTFAITFTYAGGLNFTPDWNSLAVADTNAEKIVLNPDFTLHLPCVDVWGTPYALRLVPDYSFSTWHIEVD